MNYITTLLVCLLAFQASGQVILKNIGGVLHWKEGNSGTFAPVSAATSGGSISSGVVSIDGEVGPLTGFLRTTSTLDPSRIAQTSSFQFVTAGERNKLAGLPASAVDQSTYTTNRSADLAAATNPANIVQNANYRFFSDAERTKLAGLPASAVDLSTYNGNRTNDLAAATNPANLIQNATYRLVSDTEKNLWNAKADAFTLKQVNGQSLFGSGNIVTTAGESTTNASQLTAGTLDEARLPTTAVKTTGTYSNPTFITALDPSRITQNSTNRLVSDTEKSTWNAKVDVSTVRTIAGDSARAVVKNVTITGATISESGNNVSITLPSAGSGTVVVDNTLSSSSTNPPTNAAVTSAINTISANVTSLSNTAAANQSAIASNTASLTALTTTASSNTASIAALQAQVANLLALVTTLQTQVAGISGTFTISAPVLTVSSITTSGAVVTWGASTSATSYTLESATNSTFTAGLTTITTTSGTSFTISGATAGTQYWLRIRASGGAGTTASSFGTTTFTTTATSSTLTTPTGLVATAISSTVISTNWTASASATSYTVRYSTSAGMSSPVSITTAATSLNVTGLTPSTVYYFDVAASAPGFVSSVASVTASATTQSSAAFTVTRIIRGQNMQNTIGLAVTGNVNQLKPTATQLQTAGGYTSQSLLTEGGTASGITLTNTGAFLQATGSVSTSVVTGSLYPLAQYQAAWLVSSATSAAITFNNLDPTKSYRFLGYSVTTGGTGNIVYTYSGTAKSMLVSNNLGVGGGAELDPNTALVEFKNMTPDGSNTLTIGITRGATAGSSTVPFNCWVLEEYTGTRP